MTHFSNAAFWLPTRGIAAVFFFLSLLVYSPFCLGDEAGDDERETAALSNRISIGLTPFNIGKFNFEDDGSLAYAPNLTSAFGAVISYHRFLHEGFFAGARLQYLHTYAGYDEYHRTSSNDEFSGYADILRPGLEAGWAWSLSDEHLDLCVALGAGPSMAFFEDIDMKGLYLAGIIGAAFWLGETVGLYIEAAFHMDFLWTTSASGYYKDDLEDSRAMTALFTADGGLAFRF